VPIELPVQFTFPNVASAAQQALKKLDDVTKGSTIGLKDVAKTATVVSGAFVAAGIAVKAFLDDITAVVDESHTLAASVGTTAEVIQGFRQAARATGKDLDQVIPDDFAQKLREASTGAGGAADAFKRLGVDVNNSDGTLKSFKDAIGETLDSLNENVKGTERAALAAELFGGRAKDMLTVFKDSAALDAYIEQANRFGIDVGPEASKASAGWQKANANLSLSLDHVKQTLLDVTGGQEAWNLALNNASTNVIFFTELTAGMFDILFTNIDAAVSNVGALATAFARLLSGETDFTVELKKGLFDPIEGISGAFNKAANAAIDFRKHIELTAKSGAKGLRELEEEAGDLAETVASVMPLFDFSSVLDADLALSKIMGQQWEDNLTPIEAINAEFDAQALKIKTLVAEGANRARGAEALAELEGDRVAALDEEIARQKELAAIEEGRVDLGEEALAIAAASAAALEGASTLATEIWTTNQANNRELENELKWLKQSANAKTGALDLELESLEAQLAMAGSARDRIGLESAIVDLKEQIADVDSNADKQAKILKKREEERLQDTYRDIKAFQIAATIGSGAVAAVQALAQLGPIAGAIAAAGIVATTTASSLALIRSQTPTFHIGGNPFEDQPLPGFTAGPDERQVTVTQNEIQSPADLRKAQQQAPTTFELPIMLSSQVIDKLVFEVATGSGRTGKLIRGGTDVLRRPAFAGN